MKRGSGTLLLAILAGTVFCLTSARNRVCINANSQILKLFCDGVDYTGMLPNRLNHNKCDCIFMPVCKILAVKAKGIKDGQKSMSAVSVCQTAQPTPYQNWVCKAAPKIAGTGWTSLSYSHAKWKNALKPDDHCAQCHCHKARLMPCRGSCFWNPYPPAAAVDCVTTQCALDCNTCQLTGPGNCDPGQCKYGVGTNVLTGVQSCNHRCTLEYLAWDGPNPTGKGHLKLVDTVSHSVDKIVANANGLYVGVIDLNQCMFAYRNFTTWTTTGYNSFLGAGGTLLTWSGLKTGPYSNDVYVHMGVGNGNLTFGTVTNPVPAPTFEAYLLGQGTRKNLVLATGAVRGMCTGTVQFTGVTNGPISVDSTSFSTPC